MHKNIFPPWPSFSTEEADAVSRVLLSNRVNYWTGSEGRAFEKEFSKFCDTRYAVALSNGTVALEMALSAIGVGSGDEVIVTPRTFIASASAVVKCGAIPVFADVDLDTQNITVNSVKSVLSQKTKAIIAVHLAGWPCDMDGLCELADAENIFVIEDCAQAHGAMYKGRPVGGLGDMAAWSFCQDKIMTTGGEGGMITTSNHSFWEHIWSLKDHGKSWTATNNVEYANGFRWVHDSFGTNARMTELQAVLGRIQLTKINEWSHRRQELSRQLDDLFLGLKLFRVPQVPNDIHHARYKYYTFIYNEKLKQSWTRDRVVSEINRAGVPCFSGSCPEIYLEKAFDHTGWRPRRRLQNARSLGETSIMLLVHPTITEEELSKYYEVINSVASYATA